MILQALNEYYQRSDLAPPGFEHKPIPFLVVLTADGNFAGLDDTREGEGKNKVAKSYLVPQRATKSVNVVANLLWGNTEDIFGNWPKKLRMPKPKNGKNKFCNDCKISALHLSRRYEKSFPRLKTQVFNLFWRFLIVVILKKC
jgi:hypothetical protein